MEVDGTITSGSGPDPSNPAPNADTDFYGVFDLTGISELEFDLIPDGGLLSTVSSMPPQASR